MSIGVSLDGRMWVHKEAVLAPRHKVTEVEEDSTLCRWLPVNDVLHDQVERKNFEQQLRGRQQYIGWTLLTEREVLLVSKLEFEGANC